MITAKNLKKSFKDIIAVNDISFSISRGEVFGLLGENGAGKTTTLRMLATMLTPTEGTADIMGLDLVTQPEKIRGKIGILFGGEMGLYDRLTAQENILYFAQLNGMTKKCALERITLLSQKFGMEEYLHRRAGKFSKGMKQKVAIARSIVHDPDVILFDEPTSGLDVTSTRVIHDFIKECKQQGKTIIFSSHSMIEVEKTCDRIGVIHKGMLKDIGTVDDFYNKYGKQNLEEIFMEMVGA